MRFFYHIARAGVKAGLFVGARCRVKGKDNVPDRGPLLIVANHLNLVDPPLLSVSIKRKTAFMAKEELFRARFTGYFIRSFGAFPVHRNQADMKAIRQALRILEEGTALVIFPEASRSADAKLQPAFAGAALIARRSGAPILPVGIAGTEKMRGKAWPFRRPRVTVNIGKPFHLPPCSKADKQDLDRSTGLIMSKIADLLPEEYRGHYSTQERASRLTAPGLPPFSLREKIEYHPVPSPLAGEGQGEGHKEDINAAKD